MSERMVQVPESLLRRARDVVGACEFDDDVFDELTALLSQQTLPGTPTVGDVFEHRYGTKGKRIRLTAFHDSGIPYKRYFETEVVAHPSSPQMVGRKSWVSADRLATSQFERVSGA